MWLLFSLAIWKQFGRSFSSLSLSFFSPLEIIAAKDKMMIVLWTIGLNKKTYTIYGFHDLNRFNEIALSNKAIDKRFRAGTILKRLIIRLDFVGYATCSFTKKVEVIIVMYSILNDGKSLLFVSSHNGTF